MGACFRLCECCGVSLAPLLVNVLQPSVTSPTQHVAILMKTPCVALSSLGRIVKRQYGKRKHISRPQSLVVFLFSSSQQQFSSLLLSNSKEHRSFPTSQACTSLPSSSPLRPLLLLSQLPLLSPLLVTACPRWSSALLPLALAPTTDTTIPSGWPKEAM